MEQAVKVVNAYANVYADLALSRIYEGNVEWFVSEIGSKKLLFGSDLPFMDPRPSFGRVAMAEISEEEKDVPIPSSFYHFLQPSIFLQPIKPLKIGCLYVFSAKKGN